MRLFGKVRSALGAPPYSVGWLALLVMKEIFAGPLSTALDRSDREFSSHESNTVAPDRR